MRFLLDSNIVSDIVRRPRGKIVHRISEVGEGAVCTSIIVAAELRYGATKKNSPRLTAQLEAVLGALEVLALEAPADIVSRTIKASLERKGRLCSFRYKLQYLKPPARRHIINLIAQVKRIWLTTVPSHIT